MSLESTHIVCSFCFPNMTPADPQLMDFLLKHISQLLIQISCVYKGQISILNIAKKEEEKKPKPCSIIFFPDNGMANSAWDF